MSISVRTGIAWENGSVEEPTSTIVLTGKSFFVDVRVRKVDGTLDWAFAGTKDSVPGPAPGQTRSTWHHSIDSRSSKPVDDWGILFPDPTDPRKTIELGSMLNPGTGRVEEYREIWEDTDQPGGTLVVFLEKEDGSAIIGVVGTRRLGVGRGFAWRAEGKHIEYAAGDADGADIDISVDQALQPGDRLGSWVVREYWIT